MISLWVLHKVTLSSSLVHVCVCAHSSPSAYVWRTHHCLYDVWYSSQMICSQQIVLLCDWGHARLHLVRCLICESIHETSKRPASIVRYLGDAWANASCNQLTLLASERSPSFPLHYTFSHVQLGHLDMSVFINRGSSMPIADLTIQSIQLYNLHEAYIGRWCWAKLEHKSEQSHPLSASFIKQWCFNYKSRYISYINKKKTLLKQIKNKLNVSSKSFKIWSLITE